MHCSVTKKKINKQEVTNKQMYKVNIFNLNEQHIHNSITSIETFLSNTSMKHHMIIYVSQVVTIVTELIWCLHLALLYLYNSLVYFKHIDGSCTVCTC